MATAADVIRVARSQVGVKESPPGSNMVKYGAWYGINGEPWCAMFVSWVMHQAGVDLRITTSKGYSYCPSGVSWFRARGLWRNSRLSKPGDIIFFDWNGTGVAEHTGIVLNNNPFSSSITTIEGNTSGASDANGGEVMIRTRPRSVVLGTGNMQGFYHRPNGAPPKKKPAGKIVSPKWQNDNGKVGHPPLSQGAAGEAVKHMQALLLKHGCNIVIDGSFGPATDKQLRNFQASHHLVVDGNCGPLTWSVLHH